MITKSTTSLSDLSKNNYPLSHKQNQRWNVVGYSSEDLTWWPWEFDWWVDLIHDISFALPICIYSHDLLFFALYAGEQEWLTLAKNVSGF